MTRFDEIDQLLKQADAFIAGGQSAEMIAAAQARLGVTFSASFRAYLLKWGNLSFNGYKYYGLTRNADFDHASIPNCVWFTLRKRVQVGLPESLVVFRSENDEEYYCLETAQTRDDECPVVIWDNIAREISQTLNLSFIDYLREELGEWLDEM
ncbi:Antitoxin YobK [Gimesia panareensis]|uniref:Antitoxin YobK n=1 Tax=Gimesia panareensis TaxID=2527978 RepID=A0A518FQ44_9PLAN|nr:SMI1/KNR4 family protein [Gimesia panareensis]QDV18395.1 Antitoxin YobK [Gimesia panareensis]